MRWPWQHDDGSGGTAASAAASAARGSSAGSSSSTPANSSDSSSSSSFAQYPPVKQIVSWTDSLGKTDWEQFREPQAWLPPALAVGAALGFSAFYRTYLRRIPGTNYIQPRFYRRRSLLGKVTSVGDGDNFHFYHTPGGRLAGWGWFRKVPAYRKELKGNTIPIRIAGVDAPEGAHFGRPAQPYSAEALDFLTYYILGRRVRAYLYRRDQYDRVVARVMVRRFWFFRRDVGLEMLKHGLATCYEAKTGAEFGGRETQYRIAEARAKASKRGLWGQDAETGELETPRDYKTRMAAEEAGKAEKDKVTAAAASKTAAASATSSTPSKTASATSTASTAKPAVPATTSSTSSATKAVTTASPASVPAKPSTPLTSTSATPSTPLTSSTSTTSASKPVVKAATAATAPVTSTSTSTTSPKL